MVSAPGLALMKSMCAGEVLIRAWRAAAMLKAPFLLDTDILRIVRLKEKTHWE